jgi:hypothetical protein
MTDQKKGDAMPTKSQKSKKPAAAGAAKTYTSPQIGLECLDKRFTRADLVFDGVEHAEASFEARVFLNNQDADERTPMSTGSGYAGSFHIFGHGGCFGDVGHCEVRGLPRPYDPRPAHPLTPARKVLIATEAVRRALNRSKTVTVTVVPVVTSANENCDVENVLKLDRVSIITYV